jgi:multiple antibiotic resistance protein
MRQDLSAFLFAFVTLLAMVNPVEAASAFVTATLNDSPGRKATIAKRSAIAGFLILAGFGLAGDALFAALGVTIQAFKIAGGLLLLWVAFNMVFTPAAGGPSSGQGKGDATTAPDPSVFPLAIPIMSGPGALAAAVTLYTKARGSGSWLAYAGVTLDAALVFLITYAAMRGSGMLTKRLGPGGIDVVGRLVGIVVAAIAVQFIIDGIGEITRADIH